MKAQPWMIFKPVTADIFYFFSGTFPIVVNEPAPDASNKDWYWAGYPVEPIPAAELNMLKEITRNVRKSVFRVSRKDNQKYKVVQRGVLQKEEI